MTPSQHGWIIFIFQVRAPWTWVSNSNSSPQITVLQQTYSFQIEHRAIIHNRTLLNLPTGIIMFQLNILILFWWKLVAMQHGGKETCKCIPCKNWAPVRKQDLHRQTAARQVFLFLTVYISLGKNKTLYLLCVYNYRQNCTILLTWSILIWIICVYRTKCCNFTLLCSGLKDPTLLCMITRHPHTWSRPPPPPSFIGSILTGFIVFKRKSIALRAQTTQLHIVLRVSLSRKFIIFTTITAHTMF